VVARKSRKQTNQRMFDSEKREVNSWVLDSDAAEDIQ
jgi:hypothetical protein